MSNFQILNLKFLNQERFRFTKKMGRLAILSGLSFLIIHFLPASLMAQEKPTKEAVNQVLDYFYSADGQQGPVLAKLKLCEAIHLSGPKKFDCQNEITDLRLKLGKTVVIWMQYFGIQSQNHNVILQFERDDQVLATVEISIAGSIRYRYPYNYTPKTAGNWTLKAVYANADFTEELGTINYVVMP